MIGYYLKGLLELLLLPIKIGWLVPWFIMTGFGICASICMYMSWRDSTMYMWSVHYFPGLIFPILNVRIGRSSQHALMLHACRKVRLCVHLPRNLYEQPLTRQTTHASKKLVWTTIDERDKPRMRLPIARQTLTFSLRERFHDGIR